MNKNYKAFIPIGITFLGAGIIFLITVNNVIGYSLIGVGIMWIAIGLRKRKENK